MIIHRILLYALLVILVRLTQLFYSPQSGQTSGSVDRDSRTRIPISARVNRAELERDENRNWEALCSSSPPTGERVPKGRVRGRTAAPNDAAINRHGSPEQTRAKTKNQLLMQAVVRHRKITGAKPSSAP
jgi:hypothetical protein